MLQYSQSVRGRRKSRHRHSSLGRGRRKRQASPAPPALCPLAQTCNDGIRRDTMRSTCNVDTVRHAGNPRHDTQERRSWLRDRERSSHRQYWCTCCHRSALCLHNTNLSGRTPPASPACFRDGTHEDATVVENPRYQRVGRPEESRVCRMRASSVCASSVRIDCSCLVNSTRTHTHAHTHTQRTHLRQHLHRKVYRQSHIPRPHEYHIRPL